MKFVYVLVLTLSLASNTFARNIAFKVSGETAAREETTLNEVCKVRNALTKYLSDLKCTDINIQYQAKGGFLQNTEYTIEGTASGPIADLAVKVSLAACEECNTVVTVTSRDENGKASQNKMTLLEAKYQCE